MIHLLCEVIFKTDLAPETFYGYSCTGQTEECYFSGFFNAVFHLCGKRRLELISCLAHTD